MIMGAEYRTGRRVVSAMAPELDVGAGKLRAHVHAVAIGPRRGGAGARKTTGPMFLNAMFPSKRETCSSNPNPTTPQPPGKLPSANKNNEPRRAQSILNKVGSL